MPDTTPTQPASPAPAVKPGWKSTETWLMFAGFGVLGFVLERLTEILPVLASQPNMPPWVPAVVGLAIPGLGWAMKWAASKYLQARTDLKLAASQPPATPAAAADKVNAL